MTPFVLHFAIFLYVCCMWYVHEVSFFCLRWHGHTNDNFTFRICLSLLRPVLLYLASCYIYSSNVAACPYIYFPLRNKTQIFYMENHFGLCFLLTFSTNKPTAVQTISTRQKRYNSSLTHLDINSQINSLYDFF